MTGALLWSRSEPQSSEADAAVGELLVRASGATLVAHRLSDGAVVGSFTPVANEGITGQAIAGGQILVTTTTQLVALKPVA